MNPLDLSQPQLERKIERLMNTAFDLSLNYGVKVLGAIVILIAGYLIAGFVNRAILRTLGRVKTVDPTVTRFVASTAKYAVLTFTVIAVLSRVGVQTASFIAVLGALGLAIGLALQGTLNHLASGLLLVIFRPFKVGDTIEVAGVTGTVQEITVFTTELTTADNLRLVVPNGAIWGSTVRNYSAHIDRRIDFEIAIGHDNDVGRAVELARGIIAADARVKPAPAPDVLIVRTTETAVVLAIQAWSFNAVYGQVRSDLLRALMEAFAANGIRFPAPPARGAQS